MQLDVKAVQLRRRQAMLSDGQIVPIVTMLDFEGEDTDEPEEARAVVVGPCKCGSFYRDSLECYSFAPNTLN